MKIIFVTNCSHKLKMGAKLKADYSAVLHMPILKEVKDRVYQQPSNMPEQLSYAQPGRLPDALRSCCSCFKHFGARADSCVLFFRG